MDLIHFDYSKLSEFLNNLKRRTDEHEVAFRDIKQLQQEQSDAASLQAREIRHLNEMSVSFKQGLDKVHEIDDKVNTWSERFRLIEERNYQMYKDFNDVSVSLQSQIEDLRSGFEASNTDIIGKLQAEILKKHGEVEKSLTNRCRTLEDELETLKLEQKIGIERVQRDISDRVKSFYDFFGVSTPRPSKEATSFSNLVESQAASSEAPTKSNPLKAIAMKIANIERRIFLHPSGSDIESIDLTEPKAREDVYIEIHSRFANLMREVESMKNLIAVVDTPAVASVGKPSSQETYVSINDRINELSKLKDAAPALLSLENRVANLTESMNYFNEMYRTNDVPSPLLSAKGRKNRSGTLNMFIPSELSRSEQPNISMLSNVSDDKRLMSLAEEPERDAKIPQPQAPSNQKLEEITETLNIVLRTLPQMVNVAEFEEISVLVKKWAKEKNRKTKKTESDDPFIKIDEFEMRLNKLWKQNVDLGGLIQQITNQLERNSQQILEQQDVKIGDVTVQVNTSTSEIRKQLEAVAKNMSQMATDFESKEVSNTETYLRSQILSLKRGLQETDEKLEQLESLVVGQTEILNQDEGGDEMPEIENLQSMTGLQKFQAVLNQHDKAIRLLASRSNMNSFVEEAKTRKVEASDVLAHLEDLRIEMHDMQAKYDTNKTLTVKEIEKVNEIYSLLNTKSDRQELGKKVDKSELKRLERLLRKQIEKVNEALRKTEENPQQPREDAFFMKKKIDLDCAACGQVLPNYHDHAPQFAPKERFPIRSSIFGPGFSRLLASLIPNESGGLTLPKSTTQTTSAAEFRSPNTSPPPSKISKATPSSTISRRLPKLNSKGSK